MKHLTNYDKVRQFHKAFGKQLDEKDPTPEQLWHFFDIIDEEFTEVKDEMIGMNFSKKRLAKELADLIYTAYSASAAFGIDMDVVFNRVHESNMSKLGADGKPVYRDDGKVLKGPNYKEPSMEGLGL